MYNFFRVKDMQVTESQFKIPFPIGISNNKENITLVRRSFFKKQQNRVLLSCLFINLDGLNPIISPNNYKSNDGAYIEITPEHFGFVVLFDSKCQRIRYEKKSYINIINDMINLLTLSYGGRWESCSDVFYIREALKEEYVHIDLSRDEEDIYNEIIEDINYTWKQAINKSGLL